MQRTRDWVNAHSTFKSGSHAQRASMASDAAGRTVWMKSRATEQRTAQTISLTLRSERFALALAAGHGGAALVSRITVADTGSRTRGLGGGAV